MSEQVDDAIAEYSALASAHGRATDEGDSKKANQSHDKLMHALRDLDNASPDGRLVLRRLYSHSDPWVRGWAATHLLHRDPDGAEVVLAEISKLRGFVGLDAEVTLEEWRAGRLEIP